MSSAPDNLATLKDDMVAFIEGHGMRRFHGYVDYEEVQSVVWKTEDNPDSWKDFVELAKAAVADIILPESFFRKTRILFSPCAGSKKPSTRPRSKSLPPICVRTLPLV